jgi:hypothetical protein
MEREADSQERGFEGLLCRGIDALGREAEVLPSPGTEPENAMALSAVQPSERLPVEGDNPTSWRLQLGCSHQPDSLAAVFFATRDSALSRSPISIISLSALL